MNIAQLSLTSFSLFALAIIGSFGSTAAQTYEAVANVPQTPTQLYFPSECQCGYTFPSVVHTVEVADSVTISTSPPGLIESAEDDGGKLKLTWSANATDIDVAGIKIGMPADQLTGIILTGSAFVQVLSGFTSVSYLEASQSSSINADLSTSTTGLTMKVSQSSSITVVSAANLDLAEVSQSSSAKVSAPSVTDIKVSQSSSLTFDGDIDGVVMAKQSSTVTLSGALGSTPDATESSSVFAASCPETTAWTFTCFESSPDVAVTFEQVGDIAEFGVKTDCFKWNCFGGSAATSIFSQSAGLAAAVVAGACLAM